MRRRACVTVPLFSLRGAEGIGTIGDLVPFAELIAELGFASIGLLPVQRLHGGERSPYGADSALALDPMYLELAALPAWQRGQLQRELPELTLLAWQEIARSPVVLYDDVRAIKSQILRLAYETFVREEIEKNSAESERFFAFCEQTSWLDEFTLFSAIRQAQGGVGWPQWPAPLRDREPSALLQAARELQSERRYHAWLQYVLLKQWAEMRAQLRALSVSLFGDVPFGVSQHSVEVWSQREDFVLDASLGVPPDAFSASGQDWGLPPFAIEMMRANDFRFFRQRLRFARTLYDEARLDHILGYFRQWLWRGEPKSGQFAPSEEAAQHALGRELLQLFRQEFDGAGGAQPDVPSALVAEDLGVVPGFVREVLRELGVSGYRVLPWDRDEQSGELRDIRAADALSTATFSTHDTLPINRWFSELDSGDQDRLCALANVAKHAPQDEIDLALIDYLFSAGSSRVLLLATELFGDPVRINLPGTVGAHNWGYRLPLTPAQARRDPRLFARFSAIAASCARSGRRA